MSRKPIAAYAGIGVAVPSQVVTNDDLSRTLDTSDEWIRERTGIRERRCGDASAGMPARRCRGGDADALHQRRDDDTEVPMRGCRPNNCVQNTQV